MGSNIKASIWRVIRVALAMAGTAFLGSLVKAPELIWLAPVVTALFKMLRNMYKNLWWLPL